MSAPKKTRPFFLDWRYWVLFVICVAFNLATVYALGLGDSGWRWVVYVANGVVMLIIYAQWREWADS